MRSGGPSRIAHPSGPPIDRRRVSCSSRSIAASTLPVAVLSGPTRSTSLLPRDLPAASKLGLNPREPEVCFAHNRSHLVRPATDPFVDSTGRGPLGGRFGWAVAFGVEWLQDGVHVLGMTTAGYAKEKLGSGGSVAD